MFPLKKWSVLYDISTLSLSHTSTCIVRPIMQIMLYVDKFSFDLKENVEHIIIEIVETLFNHNTDRSLSQLKFI